MRINACESTHATYFAPSSREKTSNTTTTEPPASTTVRGKILAALLSPLWRDFFHWIFKSLGDYFGHSSINYALVLHFVYLGRRLENTCRHEVGTKVNPIAHFRYIKIQFKRKAFVCVYSPEPREDAY